MGFIDLASGNSVWRGMDYYETKKVISWNKLNNEEYEGIVAGSENNKYTVHIHIAHPRKSTCNCPFADGRRVICKHMVALYFTAIPGTAEDFLRQVEEWEQEEEERELKHYQEIRDYVNSLSKSELQEILYNMLIEEEERRNNYW